MKANFPRMHVSLYVSDLQETLKFYDTFFGQAPDKVKPGYAKYILDRPSLIISFVENADRVQGSFGHLGIQVETSEEMHSRLAQARTQGIVSKEEIGTACCYAVQDKFWANDPDGHQWEIYYFHADAEFNDPRYSTEEAEACCSPAQRDPATSTPQKNEGKKKVSLASLTAEPCCEPGSGCC